MAHGLVLRLEEYARDTMEANQEVEERNVNEWSSTDKLIMYWRKSVSQSVDTKMEFVILLRETLLHVFSPDWLHSPNRSLLVQAVKENYRRFPEIVKSRPQLHEVLERIFPDPWYNSFFPWNELFQGKLTVEDKCVQEFFHSEPEDIVIGRIHSFAKCGRNHEALTLAKQSFLYYYRVTRHAVFYSKPPSRDRNRYMHEKSRLGHASIDWIVLLWRKQRNLQFIAREILQFTCHEGVEIIGRMRENPKLKKFCLECLHFLLVRDITVPSQLCCTKKIYLLFCTMHKELNSSPKDFAANATQIIARLAPSSAHLYLFVEAAYEIYGARYIDLYVDFYVRGLTADLNHLEIKKQEELHDEVESLEKHIVSVFEKLATLFFANNHFEAVRECLFSAFSLKPNKEQLNELLKLTHSLDSNSQKQLNFTSSNSSLFPVKNCSHGLKCDGSCSTANTPELTHPLLSKGIRNISYIVIQDLTTVLECKRNIRFHYNYYDWHLNISELTEYLKEFDALTICTKEMASDASNTDVQRTELSVTAAKKESTNMECSTISPVAKRKSSEIPIDVGANVEVGSQVPSKRIKVFKMNPNAFPQPVTSTPSNIPTQNSIQNAIEELIKQTLIGDKIPKGHSKVYSVRQERNPSPLDSNVSNTSSDNHTAFSPYRSYEHEQPLSFATRTPHSSQSAERYSSPAPIVRQSVVVAPTSRPLVRTEHVQKKLRPDHEVVMKSAINNDRYHKAKIWKTSLPNKEESTLNLSLSRGNAEKNKHFQNYLVKASRFAPPDPLDSASNDSCNTPPPSKNLNHNWVQQPLSHSDRNSVIHHTTQHVSNNTSPVLNQPSASAVGMQYSSGEHYQQKSSVSSAMQYISCNPQNSSRLSNYQTSFSKSSKYSSPVSEHLVQSRETKVSPHSYSSHSSPHQNRNHHSNLPELPYSVASTSMSGYSSPSQKAIEWKPPLDFSDASKQLATVKTNTVQLPKGVSCVTDQINQEWRRLKEKRDGISSYQTSKSSNSHLYSNVTTSSSLHSQMERRPSGTVSVKSSALNTDGKMVPSSVTEKSSGKSVSHQPWFSFPFPKDSSHTSYAESMRNLSRTNSSSFHPQSPFLTAHKEKSRTVTPTKTPQNPKKSSLERFKASSPLPPKPSSSSSPLLCDRLSQGSPSVQHRHPYQALDQVISRDSHGVLVFRAQNVVPASQYPGSTQACCSPLETKPCESCSTTKKSDPEMDSNSSQALNLSQQASQENLNDFTGRNQDSKMLSSIFEPKMSINYDPIVSCPYCLLELPESLITTHMENSHRDKLKLKEYDFTETKASINSTQSVYSSSLSTPRISVLKPDVKAGDNLILFNTYYNWMEMNSLTNLTREENDSTLIQYFGSDGNLAPELVKQESAIQLSNCASGIQTTEAVPILNDTPLLEAGDKATSNMMGFEKIEKNENTPGSAQASSSFSALAVEAPKLGVSSPSGTKKLHSMVNERSKLSCSFCKEQFEDPSLFVGHVKTCASSYGGDLCKASDSSNSAQMSRFCDTPLDVGGVKAEESKLNMNQRSTPTNVSAAESSDKKPKKEKKSELVPCPYCTKPLTIRYMKTHFLKVHKGLPIVKFQKSMLVNQNNPINSVEKKEEENSNGVSSPTWSTKYDPKVLNHSRLVSVNQSKEEVSCANFTPVVGEKIKCHICFRTLTNESFLKKHLKNIHGVEDLLPESCKDTYTLASKASEIKHEGTGKSHLHDSRLRFNHQDSLEILRIADNLKKELVHMGSKNNPSDSSDRTLSHDSVRAGSNSLLSQPNSAFERQLSSGDNPINKSVKTKVKKKVDKDYRCHLCPKAFVFESNFYKHIELVHKLDRSSINIKEKDSEFCESTKSAIVHNKESTMGSNELPSSNNMIPKDTFSEAIKNSETPPLSVSASFKSVQKKDVLNNHSKIDNQAQKFENNMSETEHSSEKMDKFSCTICHKVYLNERELLQHRMERHSGSLSADISVAGSYSTTQTLTARIAATNQLPPYSSFSGSNQANAKSFKNSPTSGSLVPVQEDLQTQVMPSTSKFYDSSKLTSQTSKNECTAVVPCDQNGVKVNTGKKQIKKSRRASVEALNQTSKDGAVVPYVPKGNKQASLYIKSTCDICQRTLSSPGNMVRHKKTVHSVKTIKSEKNEPLDDSCIPTSGLPSTKMIYDVEMLQNKNIIENNYPYPSLEQSEFLSDPISFPADDPKITDCGPSVEVFPPIRDNNDDFDLMLSELFGAREENDETLSNLALTYNAPEENRPLVHLEGNYATQEENRSMIPFEGNYTVQEENRSIITLEGNNHSILSLDGNYTTQVENNRSILSLERNYTAQEENNRSLLPLERNYTLQEENSMSLLPLERNFTPQKENNMSLLPLEGNFTPQEENNMSLLPLEGNYSAQEENMSLLPLEGNYTSQEELNRTLLPLEGNYAQEENNRAVVPFEENYIAQEENTKPVFSLGPRQEGNNDNNEGYDDLSNGRMEPEDWQSYAQVSCSSSLDPMHTQTLQPYTEGIINSVANQSLESAEDCPYDSLVNINASTSQTEPQIGTSSVLPSQEHPPLSALVPANTLPNKEAQKKPAMNELISRLCHPNNTCQACGKVYSSRTALRVHIKTKHMNIKMPPKNKKTKLRATQCPSSVAINSESEEAFKSNQPQTEMRLGSLTYKQENEPINALVPLDKANESIQNKPSNITEQIAHFCQPGNTCRVCQKIYSSKSALHIHVKKIHLNIRENTPKTKTLELSSSSIVTMNESGDTSNTTKEEKEKVRCPICGRKLAIKSVQRHIKKMHGNEKNDLAKFNLHSSLNKEPQETPTPNLEYNSNPLLSKREQNLSSFPPFKVEQEPTEDKLIEERKVPKDTLTDHNIKESVTSYSINNNIASNSKVADSSQTNVPYSIPEGDSNALSQLDGNEFQLNGKYPEIINAEKEGSSALLQLAESFRAINCSSRNPSRSTEKFDPPASESTPTEVIANEGASSVEDSPHPSRTESSTLRPVETVGKTHLELNVSSLEQKTPVLPDSHLMQKSCKIESVRTHCFEGALSGSEFAQEEPLRKLIEVGDHMSKSLVSSEIGSTLQEKQVYDDDDHKFVLSVLKDLETHNPYDSNQDIQGTPTVKNIENHEDTCKKVQDISNVPSALLCDIPELGTQESSSELSPNVSNKCKTMEDTSNDLNVRDNPQTVVTHSEISNTAPFPILLEVQSESKDKDVLPVKKVTLDFPTKEHVKDVDESCNASDSVLQKSPLSRKCRLCPKTFKSMSALTRHLKSAHSIPLLKKAITDSSRFSETENKLSPPNLSLALTQEVNSSKVSSPTVLNSNDSSISDNFDNGDKQCSFLSLKTSLEKNGVTVEAVSETKDNESSSTIPLQSNKRPNSRKQSFSEVQSPEPVFLEDLIENDEASNGNSDKKTASLQAVSKVNIQNHSHAIKSDNPPPLIKKKMFANSLTFEPVKNSNENKEVSNFLALEQDPIDENTDVLVQGNTVEESKHSLPKCIIKVCKGKRNSVSYQITKKEQDSMPIAKRSPKPRLRKRVKEESCDSDDSVIILSDSILSDYESPNRRNKRRRIPRKPYRDADYEKGALKFKSGFSRLPKKTSLGRKPTSKPKKGPKASVATKPGCIKTFKGLIDIQQFLREHKQPWVRLSRIEDLISNFDLKVLSYSLSDKLSKEIRVSKKVTLAKGNEINLCKTQGSLVGRKSSGYAISIKAEDSVNSKFKFKENIRKPEHSPVNSKNKDSNKFVKKNQRQCSCGMCQFCISLSPIKDCYVMLQKLPAKVF